MQQPGVSLYPTASACKLVAMLEASDDATAASVADTLLAIPGVLTVSIVAHLSDSAESLAQEVGDEAS
jgi:nitrate reductase NapAB chaperone NapD